MLVPIFILSKGRPNFKTKHAINGFPYKVFVEPQDYIDYSLYTPESRLVNIEKDEQGISYVKSYILNYAKENEIRYFWLMDDDINFFVKRMFNKNIRIKFDEIKYQVEEIMVQYCDTVAATTLDFQQNLFYNKKKYIFNKLCAVAILFNCDLLSSKNLSYDTSLALKTDIDLTLQIIKSKLLTLKMGNYGFDTPVMAKSKGGLYDVYHDKINDMHYQQSVKLIEKWGHEILELVKKGDRFDVKIHWNKI